MADILQKLHTEYNGEYKLKKYSTPRIYPKVVTEKPLSTFSEAEKTAILKKYKRRYVYCSYDHLEKKIKTGLPQKTKQASIYNIYRNYF